MYVRGITLSCVGCSAQISVISIELGDFKLKFHAIGTDLILAWAQSFCCFNNTLLCTMI